MACKPKCEKDVEKVFKAFQAAKEPIKAGDLAESLGIERKEVDNIIAHLKDQGKIESPKRCLWAIKK